MMTKQRRMPKIITLVDQQKRIDEYIAARMDRLNETNMRVILNPRGAAAVAEVIGQMPRVKSEIAAAERRRASGIPTTPSFRRSDDGCP
jgi:hypothetical protein